MFQSTGFHSEEGASYGGTYKNFAYCTYYGSLKVGAHP